MKFWELIKAIFYGILEGITEWLPVSSTGHLILLDEFMGLNVAPELGETFRAEYWNMFEVVIQLGAILAVIFLFFRKLNPFAPSKTAEEKRGTWVLWVKVLIASVPAALIGVVGDKILEKLSGKDLDGWFYNFWVVAATLILYGILFIVVERYYRNKESRVTSVDDISYRQAILIGSFQTLSIIPGTSRSGSTILGARTIGVSRPAAAEFSFFMGIPAMLGASLLKGLDFFQYVSAESVQVPAFAWIILALASIVAFVVSMLVIRFLMDFVKRHSFIPFGWYRIGLGIVLLAYGIIRYVILA